MIDEQVRYTQNVLKLFLIVIGYIFILSQPQQHYYVFHNGENIEQLIHLKLVWKDIYEGKKNSRKSYICNITNYNY